jgi:hypothetical protein
MSATQSARDCPSSRCAAPAVLGLCTCFAHGFGLRVSGGGVGAARWDDTHCLICGHFSSPYAGVERLGSDLRDDTAWLQAVEHALAQARLGSLAGFLARQEIGRPDLLAMRRGVRGLRELRQMTARPEFPQIGRLSVGAAMNMPPVFGLAHGEAESEPFARKVRVLARLLGAGSAETAPRHCRAGEGRPAWYFYGGESFVGLLSLEPNRDYRGKLTIDGCLDRLLHA